MNGQNKRSDKINAIGLIETCACEKRDTSLWSFSKKSLIIPFLKNDEDKIITYTCCMDVRFSSCSGSAGKESDQDRASGQRHHRGVDTPRR